ncbi:MAG: zinc ABC transporter substrate-binding protein [Haliangiales bacterium]
MIRSLLLSTLICASLLWAAPSHAALDVVATVPDLAALARAVGGSHVEVSALSRATQDPHWIDAKPNLALTLNRADLLLAVGAELEVGWLPKLQLGARNPAILSGGDGYLECAKHVAMLDVPTGPIDRSMGDIHGAGNPHYLLDPRRALGCAEAIAARLSALDSTHASDYRANLERFRERLTRAQAGWEKKLAPHRGAAVITYHKSWVYLTDWLGLAEVAHLEPKPGIAPTPRHVLEVLQTAKQKRVAVILQADYYPSKTGALVASRSGATLLELRTGAAFERGQGYIEHMDELIDALARGLSAGAAR